MKRFIHLLGITVFILISYEMNRANSPVLQFGAERVEVGSQSLSVLE